MKKEACSLEYSIRGEKVNIFFFKETAYDCNKMNATAVCSGKYCPQWSHIAQASCLFRHLYGTMVPLVPVYFPPLGSVTLPKNLLTKGSIEEILSSQKVIDENVEKLRNEQPEDLEPINDGDIEFVPEVIGNINVDQLIKKLGIVGS